MARSRRRVVSRQSGASSRFSYATWTKWGLIALGVVGGTYGVHRVVNSIPAGAIADSSGTEVGPHLAQTASTQKPPLPDDPGFEHLSGSTASVTRSAGPINPVNAETHSAPLAGLPTSLRPLGTDSATAGNPSTGGSGSTEPKPQGSTTETPVGRADRNLADSLSNAASLGAVSGLGSVPTGPSPGGERGLPAPAVSPAHLAPALASAADGPASNPADRDATMAGDSRAPAPSGLPSPGLPSPAGPLAAGGPTPPNDTDRLRSPGRLPESELPGAGLAPLGRSESAAVVAATGSIESDENTAAPRPRPLNPIDPLAADAQPGANRASDPKLPQSGLPSTGILNDNPNIPRLNTNPASAPNLASGPTPPTGLGTPNPSGTPGPLGGNSPSPVPSPGSMSTPAGTAGGLGGIASEPGPSSLGGSTGPASPPLAALPAGTAAASLPATNPTIGIPREGRTASTGPASGPGSILDPAPSALPRTGASAGLPQADPLAGDPRRTQAAPSSFPQESSLSGRDPSPATGGVGFSPGSRLPATMVSNRPGDPQWEIQQQAALVIEKLAPPTVQVNVPAKFLMVVRNVGRVPAGQVLIRDRIPEKARLIQANPKPTRQDGDLLEWELAALAPGEAYQIQLDLLPTEPGEIGSVAQVTSSAVAATRTRSTRPQLSIEHAAPPQVMVGQTVVMNIVVRNDGDGVAENVVIREVVPPQLMHPSGNEIENPLGNLAPGQTRTLQLPLVARTPGTARSTIRVSGDGKLSAEHSIDIQIVAPQLQVQGDGPERRFLSRPATHTFQVKNQGSANATNVQMMARLPQGLRYDSSSPAGRYDPSRHAVFWAMANLPSNSEQSVTLTTMPMAPGEQPIEFHALADLNQPQVTTRTLVVEQLSELFFDIDDLQDPIEVGTNTMYVIRVENQGSQVANNVAMVVDFPAGVEPLNVESPLEYQLQRDGQASRLVFAPVANMNPRAQMVIRVEARGSREGDHRVEVRMTSAQRPAPVAKQESTKVYADR